MGERLIEMTPDRKDNILSILNELVFDTSGWYKTLGNPASNPQYCYDWSFCDDSTGRLIFCLWLDELIVENNIIKCRRNRQKSFDDLKGTFAKVVNRITKLGKFYTHLSRAANEKNKVRVAICLRRGLTASVYKRELDPNFWLVKQDGDDFEIIRC